MRLFVFYLIFDFIIIKNISIIAIMIAIFTTRKAYYAPIHFLTVNNIKIYIFIITIYNVNGNE